MKDQNNIATKVDEFIHEEFEFNIKDGSYLYHLTRTKEAYSVGTMTIDDFEEFEEDDEFVVGFKENLKKFIQDERDKERKRCSDIIKRRTEIPKGAKNLTRDGTVLLGEELIERINQL